MERKSKLKFDPLKGKLYFGGGNCEEVRDECGAVCCRFYGVDLYEEERKNGLYEYNFICSLSNEGCTSPGKLCMNRRYVLAKKEDGSCVYLDPNNRCGIYERRPRACRDFQCDLGWALAGAAQSDDYQKLVFNSLKDAFKKEMKLDCNPATRIKTIFYSAARKEAVFVVKHSGRCGYMTLNHAFSHPGVCDETFLFIYGSFNGQRTLGEIRSSVLSRFPAVTEDAFMDIVTILARMRFLAFSHEEFPRKEAHKPDA